MENSTDLKQAAVAQRRPSSSAQRADEAVPRATSGIITHATHTECRGVHTHLLGDLRTTAAVWLRDTLLLAIQGFQKVLESHGVRHKTVEKAKRGETYILRAVCRQLWL